MTTAARSPRVPGTSQMLLRAALGSLAAVLLLTVVAALVSGTPGAAGALAGGVLVLVVFWVGTSALEVMTRRSADLALMMALVTYSGQVILVLAVFIGLSATGLVDDGTLSRGWLAAAVVLGSLVWSAAQIQLATRSRIPTYDVPERDAGDSSGTTHGNTHDHTHDQQEAGA